MSSRGSDEEIDRLVRDLAALTGESRADAVTIALRERLARLRAFSEAARVERMMRVARDTAALLHGRSVDSRALADELYDDDGLPR